MVDNNSENDVQENQPPIITSLLTNTIEENSLFPEIWKNYQTQNLPIYIIEANDQDNDHHLLQ